MSCISCNESIALEPFIFAHECSKVFRKSENISIARESHKTAGFGTLGVNYAHIDASDISLATDDHRGEENAAMFIPLRGNDKFIKLVEVARLVELVRAKPEAAFKVMYIEGEFEGRTVLREFLELEWKVFKICNQAFENVKYFGCGGKIASARAHLSDRKSPYMTSWRGFYLCVNKAAREVRLVIIIFSFCRFPDVGKWLWPDYTTCLATVNVLRTLQGLKPVSYTNNDLYKAATSDRFGGRKHLHKMCKVDYQL